MVLNKLGENSDKKFKAGDFTGLAKDYSKHRPDYCPSVLKTTLDFSIRHCQKLMLWMLVQEQEYGHV